MATLVLDTLWSEYNIEQLKIWDTPFYESAEIKVSLTWSIFQLTWELDSSV